MIFLAVARGETRLLFADAPAVAWRLLGIASWAFFAMLMGSIIGFAAVALPPMGLVGIITVFVLVLLWVLPEGPTPPQSLIRWLMFMMVVVDLTIPAYYTYQIPGLPWISLRRVFTFAVIMLFMITYSASAESRGIIAKVVSCNRATFVCSAGYLVMVYASIITSVSPFESLSAASTVVSEWYVPFIVTVYVIRREEDVTILLELILCCALIVSIVGQIDYNYTQNTYVKMLPDSLVDSLLANNPQFSVVVGSFYRNGVFRAKSMFNVALSFAEFEAIVAPIAVVFFLHGRFLFQKLLAMVVLSACSAGIYVSGSRGGYLSLLTAALTFAPLFVLRSRVSQPRGLKAPISSVLAVTGFFLMFLAIEFAGRVHSVIFASGAGADSDEARNEQWAMGWAKILENPITGHGYAMGGDVLGYSPDSFVTIDSFALSLLIETGVPGLVFYFGIFLLSVYIGARQYVRDTTFAGALAGGLAASLSGYVAYRLFLSQRENQTLVYIIVACVCLLNYFYRRRLGQFNCSAAEG